MNTFIAAFTLIATSLFALPALAHIQLLQPTQRISAQKTGPCGTGDSDRGPATTFQAGETITVVWEETVEHPSHYRISFDPDGHDAFVDPPTMMDFYSNDAVLLDDIEDEENAIQEVEITLPDITCDRCTLQVVQVMYDKPPYEPGTNDLYYQCADLILVDAPQEDAGNPDPPDMGSDSGVDSADMNTMHEHDMGSDDVDPDPRTPINDDPEEEDEKEEKEEGFAMGDDDSTCSVVSSGAHAPILLVLVAFFGLRRRRRS